MRLEGYVMRTAIEATPCAHCRTPLGVGDRAFLLESRDVLCSEWCAEQFYDMYYRRALQ